MGCQGAELWAESPSHGCNMKADFPVPTEAGCQGGSGPGRQRTPGLALLSCAL